MGGEYFSVILFRKIIIVAHILISHALDALIHNIHPLFRPIK